MLKWVIVFLMVLTMAYFGLSAIKQLNEISKYRIDYYEQLIETQSIR